MHIFLSLLIMLISGCEQKASPPDPSQIEKNQSAPKTHSISRVNTESIPILMYHSIGINQSTLFVPPEVFYKQMEHLKNTGYNTITFKDLMKWKTNEELPDKPILITFDDGYLDNFSVAYPILKKLQMKATIFATSDFIGSPNHLNWSQIKEMEQSGSIEIGVHTRHHVELTKINQLQLVDEVCGAKQRLEKRLGHPTIAFAYPSGKFNQDVVQVVKRAGFEFAVTTKPGYAEKKQGYLTLHRVRIQGEQSIAAFIRKFP
ncbi:polysaccharide deacetylase family protein [Paenibacillus sp. KQZ6P-2]|uniref:Polysaccharide deacetylase family protein n=1 Tax=Paenibacillus mangrovi TaxID=2931978 RepID=A0A9X2B4J8_9BACL|nr:polysaccharide deacetylase family protein [Paenibacillus mangrovi]MCJ8014596.1 polysaccharide deacetylase family protein [Paenibacillus mangrovi]